MERNQVSTRDFFEQLVGCTFFLGCSFGLFKQFRILRKVFKNYEDLLNRIPDNVNFNKFYENPGLKEYVVLPHFNCMASDHLFKNHMKMVGDYKTESNQTHSYPQPCNDFDGDVIVNNKHLKFYCNCKSMSPFVSSSLLCNVQAIYKQHIKTRVTMMIYGEMEYNKDKNLFTIYPQIMGTTKHEILNAWYTILGVSSPLFLAFFGLLFGVGSSIVFYQRDRLVVSANRIKEEIMMLVEPKETIEKTPDIPQKQE